MENDLPESHSFLGVRQSSTGRRWVARPFEERLALALSQRFALPDLLACSLAARGITLEEAPTFLEPRLRDLMPDPSGFRDMDVAVDRVAEAIKRQEKIAIFGDYDVDGATSSALLMRFMRHLGVEAQLYVPDRLREGYGPNSGAMQKLAQKGVRVVICVDCGTTAYEALASAKTEGLEVIVLDHHAPESHLPPAVAVVNPNRLDEDGRYGYLAAVGVTYLFAVALNRALRRDGYYTTQRPEPDLLSWLDLVALGTVCDVVKLVGLNRAYVAQGLRIMGQNRNIGLKALAQVAGCKASFDAFAAGFQLGPRVNAGGRVGEADLGARLLSTEDPETAATLAAHLHALNDERRAIEARVLSEAEAIELPVDQPFAFVASENWHPGVIGIVASRLKDKFHHPALVISLEGNIGKGSGRSINGIDLGAHIIAARQAGLLINGGGHKMAAGFTVARDRIEAFRRFLVERVGRQLAEEPLCPLLTIDGLVAALAVTPEFVRELSKLGPFGTGNSEPRFVLADCHIVKADLVGEKHVSVILTQGATRIRGIAFRAAENGLGDLLLARKKCHVAGHFRLEEWQGEERVQIHINDAAAIA